MVHSQLKCDDMQTLLFLPSPILPVLIHYILHRACCHMSMGPERLQFEQSSLRIAAHVFLFCPFGSHAALAITAPSPLAVLPMQPKSCLAYQALKSSCLSSPSQHTCSLSRPCELCCAHSSVSQVIYAQQVDRPQADQDVISARVKDSCC